MSDSVDGVPGYRRCHWLSARTTRVDATFARVWRHNHFDVCFLFA